jgi:GrpB-like predicted nucleotidyltransferase (UPF0157 family)
VNDEVSISDYDIAWPALYAEEAACLCDAFGADQRDIQHVGSTAVPGLAAKPVIDIMVATGEIVQSRESIIIKVDPLGYVNVPHDEDPERLFFRKGDPRTYHLHVVKFRSWTYWKHIMFRDYLIDHPTSAEEYECLKLVLAERHRSDRDEYVRGKEPFVDMALWRAVKERVIDLR